MATSDAGDLQEPCGFTYQQLGELSDEIVMTHLGASHGDAVAVLFDRYSRLVLSIASKIVRDHAEAEDLTQAIPLTAHSLPRFPALRVCFAPEALDA